MLDVPLVPADRRAPVGQWATKVLKQWGERANANPEEVKERREAMVQIADAFVSTDVIVAVVQKFSKAIWEHYFCEIVSSALCGSLCFATSAVGCVTFCTEHLWGAEPE